MREPTYDETLTEDTIAEGEERLRDAYVATHELLMLADSLERALSVPPKVDVNLNRLRRALTAARSAIDEVQSAYYPI